MKLRITAMMFILSFILSGCVVRTYTVTKDRVDQDLSEGNRGYLAGQAPRGEAKERKKTRTSRVVEIELHSPMKLEKMPKEKEPVAVRPMERIEEREQGEPMAGNRGYITERVIPETRVAAPRIEKYKVQKGDTLQKISQKFYGTTRKWNKIYQANMDSLKGPDKIYPGQMINVPVEGLKEPVENLK